MIEIEQCASPEATYGIGRAFGERLVAGDVVLFDGGLGAGKTLFVKGVAEALGYDPDEVTSPSFSLVNLYPTGEINIYHIDLWRLDEGIDAAAAVGLGEILDEPNAIVLIEWADRIGGRTFEREPYYVSISGDGDDPRTIRITQKS